MLLWLLAGVGLLCAGMLMFRWLAVADPKSITFAAKVLAVCIGILLAVALVFSGRAGWLLTLLFILPLILRRLGQLRSATLSGFGGGGSASQSRVSTVQTLYLDMRLDHEQGELDGQVLQGRFARRLLSDLSVAQLLELAADFSALDQQSLRVLEAYLDRRDPGWRIHNQAGEQTDGASAQQEDAAPASAMTAEDAYRILGLSEGAGEEAIKQAHHRLIAGVHPDKGGSPFLAAQVNRARDVLLEKTRRSTP